MGHGIFIAWETAWPPTFSKEAVGGGACPISKSAEDGCCTAVRRSLESNSPSFRRAFQVAVSTIAIVGRYGSASIKPREKVTGHDFKNSETSRTRYRVPQSRRPGQATAKFCGNIAR
jgi:hypothetical protein